MKYFKEVEQGLDKFFWKRNSEMWAYGQNYMGLSIKVYILCFIFCLFGDESSEESSDLVKSTLGQYVWNGLREDKSGKASLRIVEISLENI